MVGVYLLVAHMKQTHNGHNQVNFSDSQSNPVNLLTLTWRTTMSKLITLASIRNAAKKFHSDERGLEALQVVMIIAVAAIVMLLVKNNYETLKGWMETLVGEITGWTAA